MSKRPPAGQTKRQTIREQRQKRQRQKRLYTILAITGVAVLIAALLIVPQILENNRPVGEITEITPREYPQADGAALGSPDAPVLVEVWSDFQCPACKSYAEQVETQVIDNYVVDGRVRYVYRHYPFLDDRSAGKESDQAANASMCAADLGKFWEYHEILFANWNGENEGAFADRRLLAFAESLGLDMSQFESCFNENRFEDQIQADFVAGQQAGVQGTPSVFVNGTHVAPGFVPSYDQMVEAIEAALAAQSQ
jgi:protein-disulfide isomerase